MVKKFTVLRYNQIDSTGDTFAPGSIVVRPGKKIPVLHNFDQTKVIGFVSKVENVGDEMICTAELTIDPKGLFPAVGFRVEEDKTKRLFAIGLSETRNVDPEINPL